MNTLLQTLLIQTLPEETDSILRSYIEKILPEIEREFSTISALGGSYEVHLNQLLARGDKYAEKNALSWSSRADQNLCVHVLNALLTAWNLSEYLSASLALSEVEKRLLCLGITLHDYNKYCNSQGENDPPKAYEVAEILKLCEELGEKLNFQLFWSGWKQYLPEIGFLAQNTQFKASTNPVPSNWPTFTLNSKRLKLPLRHLLGFGDVAVHLEDPAGIEIKTGGERLQEHLKTLGIQRKLVYHRLRNSLGILSNAIHNSVVNFGDELGWKPILFFAQGVVYLTPLDSQPPDILELKEFLWREISQVLAGKMSGGEVGFKRDGKGLKIASQTLELFSSSELIRLLPDVINARVANVKNPATPKRLEKLELSETEREILAKNADIRADKIAEFIILVQREFFENCPEFITWMLETLQLQDKITPEQTQEQSGGVNYGWYRVAADYIANNARLRPEDVSSQLLEIAENLADWAETNNLLSESESPTKAVFNSYLEQYLEVGGWENKSSSFEQELTTYTEAKTKAAKQPICSLSSGEFPSEDQMDSVVLFKPQQYSNKNSLGGRKIKRGISKIWSLEMLLRQAIWRVPAGKLEEQQPIFLYIFPAYVYSPQTAKAVQFLVNDIKRVSLWNVRKKWLEFGLEVSGLQAVDWLHSEAEAGEFAEIKYSSHAPFMAMTYTTPRGKTQTDAWVQPAFLALALPLLLGVKVVTTASSIPLYSSDSDFRDSVILDGVVGFWQLLGLPTSLRIQELYPAIKRLLVAYCLHLDNRSKGQEERWQAFNGTVREVMTNVLNVFTLANEGLRRDGRDFPKSKEVKTYWKYAEILSEGDENMTDKLKVTKELVSQYRQFYQVNLGESSHAILFPLSKALEAILSVPENWDNEELILQGAGQIQAALDRQEAYKRPIIKDKSIAYEIRQQREFEAIHTFMKTCVEELFEKMCKGDIALLQENRNRIKAGAEFAYRMIALEERASSNQLNSETLNNED
ncbi:MAG: type I-D CRISPR-associated protein Cas10d/Csc3 [Limnoraphis sp. WC205]|jgi:CRISPR-associated protein Csc3|nr:type I-D CRISPR-associated protein Cas10d/Csc3 [Limnoraphis sp. WC205]